MRFTALIELLYHRLALANPVRPARRQQRSFVPSLDVLEDRSLWSAVSFGTPLLYPALVGETGGNAVAVGDFNNDGKLDLAVTNPQGTSLRVLLGNGDGTFRVASSPGQFPSSSLAVGDFNGDGNLDLAVASDSSVSVLLGNGDGTFQTARDFAAGPRVSSVAVGDFDGRHYANGLPILDLVTANFYSNTVSVLLGNGDGTFQTARNIAVASGPSSVAIGDLNGDGKADLVVADAGDFYGNNAGVSVLLGNGDGTFQTAQVFAAGIPSIAVAVADFNGDGKPDLALTNGYGGGVHVLLGNGDGTFRVAQEVEPLPFSSVDQVAVGDFNGDGKPDLVTVTTDWTRVLLGNGDGTFGVAQAVGPQDDTFGQVAVGDFNGDGKPDLARMGYVLLNQSVTTTALRGPTSSTYGQPVTYTATVTSDAPVRAGTVTFFDTGTPVSPALPLDENGQATFSFTPLSPGSHTITASYSGAAGGAGFTGFSASAASTGLTVNPAPLSASAVNFSATAGAPFSGAVATFINADPSGSAASYTATIDWGDGTTSSGTISGTGTLTVSGFHTYADPNSYALSVQISHNLGEFTAMVYPTATVTTLGQGVQDGLTGGVGFWHNNNGQALINAFNGGPDATALSSWLALNFPNLYGSLTGASNAQVAAFYQAQFALSGSNLAAEVLATALNIYATTQSLGGTIGQAYGFTVTATGLGADSFNVGADGAAFGMANNTTRNVYELLRAVDQQAVFGVLYNGDTTLQREANDRFDALNKAGSI
jgi:hypothetical protein